MERLQFIVELEKLNDTPCERYLQHFVDGKADALELLRLEGEHYAWLYEKTNYDLIGFQIQHNIFDWEKYGCYVAKYCPQYFDPEKYNWKMDSWAVAKYCPEHLDPMRYNWENHSDYVERFCPHLKPQQ